MYLISAYFDDNTNQRLQSVINKIAAKTGNDFMVRNNVPPHLTISSIEARNVEVLIPAFKELSMSLDRLPIGRVSFASVGQLLPYVMFIAPVLNEYLLNIANAVYEAFTDIPETSIIKFYRPLSWMPHVTLGKTLNKDQMRVAFEVMQEEFTPFDGYIERLGLSKVNPHEEVARIELK